MQVPFLPCYAAASFQLEFYAIPREEKRLEKLVAKPFTVDNKFHRVEIIHIALLLYCVIEYLVRTGQLLGYRFCLSGPGSAQTFHHLLSLFLNPGKVTN